MNIRVPFPTNRQHYLAAAVIAAATAASASAAGSNATNSDTINTKQIQSHVQSIFFF